MESTDQRSQSIFEALSNENPMDIPIRPAEIDQANLFLVSKKLNPDDMQKAKSKVYIEFEDYFEKKWKAELHNYNNFKYIYDSVKRETDENKLRIFYIKLDQFKSTILRIIKPYVALRIDFDLFPYPSKISRDGKIIGEDIQWAE